MLCCSAGSQSLLLCRNEQSVQYPINLLGTKKKRFSITENHNGNELHTLFFLCREIDLFFFLFLMLKAKCEEILAFSFGFNFSMTTTDWETEFRHSTTLFWSFGIHTEFHICVLMKRKLLLNNFWWKFYAFTISHHRFQLSCIEDIAEMKRKKNGFFRLKSECTFLCVCR